jgi:hypothetical protein
MFDSWPCIADMVVAWVLIDSFVAAYAAPKFASNSLYNAINESSSMAAIPYPCCEAGTAVWLTSAIAPAQYSLKELIVLMIGGVLFLGAIQFLYSLVYIPHHLMTHMPMSMMSRLTIGY